MTKTYILIFVILLPLLGFSQDLIQLKDGRTILSTVTEINEHSITLQNDKRTQTIALSNVVLIEYLEDGLVYYDTVNQLNYVKNATNPITQKGNKVYIPFSSTRVAQRCGSLHLRKLIEDQNIWHTVNTPLEADFILKYIYSDKGKDHAYLEMCDNKNNTIWISGKVGASDWVPQHAGEESAESLFNKYIKKFPHTL